MNPKNPNRATQRSALVTQRELTKTVTRLFDLSLTDMCEAALARQDDIERMAGFLHRMFSEGNLARTSFSEAKADARKFTVFVQTLYRYAEALWEETLRVCPELTHLRSFVETAAAREAVDPQGQ